MRFEDKAVIGIMMFGFSIFGIAFGMLVWGVTMLEDSFERQEQNRQEYANWLMYEKPLRDQLMKDAERLGFNNSDLIMNATGLCWYDSDKDSLFGQCDGQRERIDSIHLESNPNYRLASPIDGTWHSVESDIVYKIQKEKKEN